jgi:hypothetical protein
MCEVRTPTGRKPDFKGQLPEPSRAVMLALRMATATATATATGAAGTRDSRGRRHKGTGRAARLALPMTTSGKRWQKAAGVNNH